MKTKPLIFAALCSAAATIFASSQIVSDADFDFLEKITRDTIESSRVESGAKAGGRVNNLGYTIIRPGGRDCYPSFWVRDYAMALPSGFITLEEQKNMLLLTAKTQCDAPWITKKGALVPAGAIADHVRIEDGLPVYFPGTYSWAEQGAARWGRTPPVCDHFYFVDMAYFYFKNSKSSEFLKLSVNGKTMMERLEAAFNAPATDGCSRLVYTTAEFRAVDHGFKDTVGATGHLCYSSLLKFKAANELAELSEALGDAAKAEKYRGVAASIKADIPKYFLCKNGMLKAATQSCAQCDVWATSVAVRLGVLEGAAADAACRALAGAYKSGRLCQRGNVRHVPLGEDFSGKTMWEKSSAAPGKYQNGAYWGTPVGWVALAIARADIGAARRMAAEYIAELRQNDYRKGENFGAPYECFNENAGGGQNPVYMTSVASPYIAFKNARENAARLKKD